MEDLVEEILRLNAASSDLYTDPDVWASRKALLKKYRVRTIVFKCMDGRIDLSASTNSPLGVMVPFRTIGGIFDLGWPALAERLGELVSWSIDTHYRDLFIVTYHFSEGAAKRGCYGVGYDKEKGISNALRFVRQIENVFGTGRVQTDVIMVGVETDNDVLILHDRAGVRRLAVSSLVGFSPRSIKAAVRELYPDMKPKVMGMLLRFVDGNIGRILELRRNPRPPIELEHTERVLGLGHGFDWLQKPNFALVVNPYDPRLDDATAAAADIIGENRKAKRIPEGNGLFISSIGYRSPGYWYRSAVEQSRYLAGLGMRTLRERNPQLEGFFQTMIGVVDMTNRKLQVIEVNGKSA